jgi:hypothetical protein
MKMSLKIWLPSILNAFNKRAGWKSNLLDDVVVNIKGR